MQYELAETKQHMKLYWLLVCSWNCWVPRLAMNPSHLFATCSTDTNMDRSQCTRHSKPGPHSKSKEPQSSCHSTAVLRSHWLHVSKGVTSKVLASTATRGVVSTPCFCVFDSDPLCLLNLISGLFILQLKVQKWNLGTNTQDAPLEKWKGVNIIIIASSESSKQCS